MKNLDYVLLLDCYGSLLTERQRNLLEGYYDEDLSLAELADPLGISRQAVHDSIKRGERQLEAYEQQMGIAARLKAARTLFAEIEQCTPDLPEPQRSRITEAARQGLALFTI
ncbi:MAG: helix-turn-helix domain-containing protein [Oscillospiraceae bacterium]|nr:helix-turn-helix domain-containing protein [Oscillospiraceae bacterium]